MGLTHSDASDSGLYITDLEAISTIEGLTIEQGKQVHEILEDARRVAILSLNADLTALMLKYVDVRKPYMGKIGNSRWKSKTKGGAELVVVCRPLRNATLHIDAIGAIFQNAGQHVVTVTSNTGLNDAFIIDCTANKLSTKNVALALPLYSPMVDFVEYRFGHEQDHCVAKLEPCSSCRMRFSYANPRFTEKGITSYVTVGGYKDDRFINSSAGLVLAVRTQCRLDNLICDEEIDFSIDPAAQMYAQAVQYKAGSVVVWNCLRNPNLNRVLMEDAEDLREAAKYYERRYRDMMLFINKHYDYNHDCVCKKRSSWIGHRK